MKVKELPGQFVWLNPGLPILFRSDPSAPDRVGRNVVVRVERLTEPVGTLPALAIWSDAEGEHGVDARRVVDQVMSLPPSGESPVQRIGEALSGRGRTGRG